MKARFYVVVNYLLRYILLGFSFYTAIKRPDVSIVATIIAFLSVKVVILISNIFNFYPYEEEITRKEGG